MKKILLSIIVLLSSQCFAQKPLAKSNSVIQVIDSVYNWTWMMGLGTWEYDEKTIDIIYDANFNVTGKTYVRYDQGVWKNANKQFITYDADNYEITNMMTGWDGVNWLNQSLYSKTNDAAGNVLVELRQEWDDAISAWKDKTRITRTYNANNDETSYLSQNHNGTAWVNSSQNFRSYDANNNLINFHGQNWTNNVWKNSYQYIYTYDSNNNLINEQLQNGSGTSGWVDYRRTANTFDSSNNLTFTMTEEWGGSGWAPLSRKTFNCAANNTCPYYLLELWDGSNWYIYLDYNASFDAANNVNYYLTQRWNSISSTWYNWTGYSAEYDANNFQFANSNTQYMNGSSAIQWADSMHYYYSTVTVGLNESSEKNIFTVYPNPSKGKFRIVSE